MSTPPTVPLGQQFKLITHLAAVVVVGTASFFATPAGTALIKQYPHLSVIASTVVMLATLYHTPKED